MAAGMLAVSAQSIIPGGVRQASAQTPEPSVTPTASPTPDPTPPPPEPAPAVAPGPSFPALPGGSGSGRRVVYSNSAQRVWLVEADGSVSNSWLVSGRRGSPRAGFYKVFSKSRYTSALGGRVRMEYMVRFARGRRLAIGFHSIPVTRRGVPIQSEAELGQFRSAGCVRQRYADAVRLWDFAPVGTPVVVTR